MNAEKKKFHCRITAHCYLNNQYANDYDVFNLQARLRFDAFCAGPSFRDQPANNYRNRSHWLAVTDIVEILYIAERYIPSNSFHS